MNSEGSLKNRHYHWTFGARNEEGSQIVEIGVIAFDESSALEVAKSILVRSEYRLVKVWECFTPHDNSSGEDIMREMMGIMKKGMEREIK